MTTEGKDRENVGGSKGADAQAAAGDKPQAGGGTGTTGGLTTEDLKSGFGVTGGPGTVGESDDTKGTSGNAPGSSATGG